MKLRRAPDFLDVQVRHARIIQQLILASANEASKAYEHLACTSGHWCACALSASRQEMAAPGKSLCVLKERRG